MRKSRYVVLLAASLLGLAALIFLFAVPPRKGHVLEPAPASAAVDPRLAYDGPFQNVHPDVGYVGSETCGTCHVEIARRYARHPMARSLAPIGDAGPSPPEDGKHNHPFRAAGSVFSILRGGRELIHRRTWGDSAEGGLFQLDLPVSHVFGSGQHGYSFLSERDGYLFQTPISWYEQKKTWDLSPGFEGTQLLGRPIHEHCLFCHADQVKAVPGTMNHYRLPLLTSHGIGCERCHGPGEKHVADPGHFDPATATDYSIVNPAKLAPAQREAVCQQCHLEGEGRVLPRGRGIYDFRPGLPLESCWSIFVTTDAQSDRHAVNHVEQMHASQCFQKSDGTAKLGCISCHDPHRQLEPQERVAFYRQRCLKCHAETASVPDRPACALAPAQRRRQNPQDSCIACHMPRYRSEDVVHQAATEHRIRRRSGNPNEAASRPARDQVGPVVHFHLGQVKPDDPDRSRDMGIGMVRLLAEKQLPAWQIDPAIQLLDEAVRRCPDDLPAWEEKAKALTLEGRKGEALLALETILAREPRREISLMLAASLAQAMEKEDDAARYWKRAVDINPWAPEYRGALSTLLAGRQDWKDAQVQCAAWLRLDPGNMEARQLWIMCLAKEGKRTQALAELLRIEPLRPSHLKELKKLLADRGRKDR
jgi:tetratricopeptide (TPR) repeat protein